MSTETYRIITWSVVALAVAGLSIFAVNATQANTGSCDSASAYHTYTFWVSSSVPQYLVDECNKYGGKLPGAKGVPEEMLREAAKGAICKINIDTDLRLAMTASIRKVFVENPAEFDPRKYLGPARDEIKRVVKHKIANVLGCTGMT